MTNVVLAANQYGKAENRVVRVTRDTDRHEVADLNVTSQLRGDFAAAHTDGDNSHVVADRHPEEHHLRLRAGRNLLARGVPAAAGRTLHQPVRLGHRGPLGRRLLRLDPHQRPRPRLLPGLARGPDRRPGPRPGHRHHAQRVLRPHRDEDHPVRLCRLPQGQVHDPGRDRGPDPGHRHLGEVALQHHRAGLQRGLRQCQADDHDGVLGRATPRRSSRICTTWARR